MKFPIFVTGTLENILVFTFFWTGLDSNIYPIWVCLAENQTFVKAPTESKMNPR
jgi:hypothetical protein